MRVLLASLLLVPGCLISGGGDGYPEDTSAVIITDDCPGEAATADTASYVGTDITVTASYGGCEATRLWVCWSGDHSSSGPLQVPLQLRYKPAGDCDALLSSSLTFSVAPVVDGNEYLDPLYQVIFSVGGQRVEWRR